MRGIAGLGGGQFGNWKGGCHEVDDKQSQLCLHLPPLPTPHHARAHTHTYTPCQSS